MSGGTAAIGLVAAATTAASVLSSGEALIAWQARITASAAAVSDGSAFALDRIIALEMTADAAAVSFGAATLRRLVPANGWGVPL
jgi:hypothetical protein